MQANCIKSLVTWNRELSSSGFLARVGGFDGKNPGFRSILPPKSLEMTRANVQKGGRADPSSYQYRENSVRIVRLGFTGVQS